MLLHWFLPNYLVWLSFQWPFVHVRKGRIQNKE